MKLSLLLGLLLSYAIVAHANSDVSNNYDYSSTYFDLGAGWGTIQNLPTGVFTGSAAVGYQFNRYLSVEAGWDGMPSQQWGMLDNYNVYSLSIKGILPLNDSFELYGKLGSGVGYSTWSGSGPGAYSSAFSATTMDGIVGVGASLKVSSHFKLYLENKTFVPLTNQPGNFSTANTITFGFQYNFSLPTLEPIMVNVGNKAQDIEYSMPQSMSVGTLVSQSVQQSQKATSNSVAVNRDSVVGETLNKQNFDSRIQMQGKKKYIIIRSNDTLFSISRNSQTALEQLETLNHIKNINIIKQGTRLYLN